MGHGYEETSKRGRKRSVEQAVDTGKAPSAKRPALATVDGPEQQERVRSSVRALFQSYNALCYRSGGSVDSVAFQALLKAAQGDVASQRLAARLVPRFIALFPDQVEVAAGALIKLYELYQNAEGFSKPLEVHTRRDALQGLQAVLLAASVNTAHGNQAVKLILSVLFKLLPQLEKETPSTEEPEEEEGEVAPHDGHAAAAAVNGPWVRKVLRQALQQHPVTTLTFCFGCLGTQGRGNASAVGPAMVQGVRLWLRDHILREATPSREGTPMDCDGATGTGAGPAATAAGEGGSSARGAENGTQASKAASVVSAAAAAAAAGAGASADAGASGLPAKGCVLQAVLQSSPELRVWVRQESKGLQRAPEDVKAVLQAALQLVPPEKPPAATKRPGAPLQHAQQRPGPPGATTAAAAAGHNRPAAQQQQQQPPQFQQSPSQQQQQQQHKAPNGVVPRPVNGMEPLGRSWSTPSPAGGRGASRSRTATGRPPDTPAGTPPAAAAGPLGGQFPQPAGPICRLVPCVLLSNVPRQVSSADLQQQLSAVEAWIMDQQPPAAGGANRSAPGARACCVLKGPLDAARTYMRHHKANPFGPQHPPMQVFFADRLPNCSRSSAAAAGAPSVHLWALRAVAGDAEKITDDLREAGLIPKSVSRVNHGSEPGTVLEAHTPKEAADMLAFLLKAHPAAAAAAAQQQAGHEELPPLPEPPAGNDWTPGSRGSKLLGPGAAAASAGGAASRQPLQQQQGPPLLGGQPPAQQQQALGASGFRRSNSFPVGAMHRQHKPGAAEGNWHNSLSGAASTPGSWVHPGQQQQQQQWGPGPPLQQQQQPWQQQGPSSGWQGASQHPQQQQQGRWQPPGHPSAAAAGPPGPAGASPAGLGPFPGAAGSQQQQGQGHLQRQHSFAGASPAGAGGGTPAAHTGSPAGPAPPSNPGPSIPGGVVPALPGGNAQQQYIGAQILWQGGLYKSEVRVGTVCCVEAAGSARQSGTAPEPHFWPEALHINHRISVNDALEHYAAAAPHTRAVRVLLPQESVAGNVQAISNFVQYLTTKGRAGMVKLPAGNGTSARSLYLIVPRAQVCQSLQVAWDGRCVMLIVVIVPQPGVPGSSGGGAAGGGKAALPGPPGSMPYAGSQQHIGHRPMR